MWAEGASQKEVERELGVYQGTLSKRIKAALNEVYKAELDAKQFEKLMQEEQQEEDLETQRREESLRAAVTVGDSKRVTKLLPNHPQSDDVMARTSTGGKTHERWAVDPDDVSSGRVGPTGAGPDG
jgi:hypothetical protein